MRQNKRSEKGDRKKEMVFPVSILLTGVHYDTWFSLRTAV